MQVPTVVGNNVRPVYGPDGQIFKKETNMGNGYFEVGRSNLFIGEPTLTFLMQVGSGEYEFAFLGECIIACLTYSDELKVDHCISSSSSR